MQTYDEEYWLSGETREIPLPGGARPFTMMRIHWGSFDALIREHDFTTEKLVDLGVESALHNGKDFDTIFPECIAYLDREFSRIKKQYPQAKQPPEKRGRPVSKVQIEQLQAEIDELEASRPEVPE